MFGLKKGGLENPTPHQEGEHEESTWIVPIRSRREEIRFRLQEKIMLSHERDRKHQHLQTMVDYFSHTEESVASCTLSSSILTVTLSSGGNINNFVAALSRFVDQLDDQLFIIVDFGNIEHIENYGVKDFGFTDLLDVKKNVKAKGGSLQFARIPRRHAQFLEESGMQHIVSNHSDAQIAFDAMLVTRSERREHRGKKRHKRLHRIA